MHRTLLALALLASSCFFAARAIAEPAPNFTLSDRQDQQITLSQLQGQLVWLDFWASWCHPCRKAFPWLNRMQEKYGPQGFKVVAVNVDVDRALADRFLADVPANFTVLFDTRGEVSQAYQLPGMPTSILIDPQGQMVEAHVGFKPAKIGDYEAAIKAALKSQADSGQVNE